MPVRTALRPGTLSPTLPVPRSIARPEYVGKRRRARAPSRGCRRRRPSRRCGSPAGSPRRRTRRAGKAIAPGVTTDEIDRVVHEYICDHGAYPSTLGYKGFPKSCCTSLNEVICHGIPDSTVIEDGDIVNIDVTAYIDGVHGDTDATYLAGDVAEEHRLLVERTHEATMRAIKAVAPGRQLNVVGRVIESYAKRFGYGVVRDFTGHGIGRTFHTGWSCCTTTSPPSTPCIEPGMTFTIEPMITLGGARLRHLGRRLDRGHQGPEVDRAVRAHAGGHRRRRRDPDPAVSTSGALLVAGTTSDAGKCVVVAGLCRLLAPQGCSRRAVQGPEHVQQLGGHRRRRRDRPGAGHAGAARRAWRPTSRFNPVLLKPGSDRTVAAGRRAAGSPAPSRAGDYAPTATGWPSVVADELAVAARRIRRGDLRGRRIARRDQPAGNRPGEHGAGPARPSCRSSWSATSTGAACSRICSARSRCSSPTTRRWSPGSWSTSSAATRRCSHRGSTSCSD